MTKEQAIEIYFLEDSDEQIRRLALLRKNNELNSNDLFNFFSIPAPMAGTTSPYIPVINMLLCALQNVDISKGNQK